MGLLALIGGLGLSQDRLQKPQVLHAQQATRLGEDAAAQEERQASAKQTATRATRPP